MSVPRKFNGYDDRRFRQRRYFSNYSEAKKSTRINQSNDKIDSLTMQVRSKKKYSQKVLEPSQQFLPQIATKEETKLPEQPTQLQNKIKTQGQTTEQRSPLTDALDDFRREPSEDKLTILADNLIKHTFIFRSVSYKCVMSLLYRSSLKLAMPGQYIYMKGQPSRSVLIILSGKVRLANKSNFYKRFSRKQETLGEEILYPDSKFMKDVMMLESYEYPRLETVKAMETTHLLEIKPKELTNLYQKLVTHGHKAEAYKLQSIFWKSFTAKTSQRLECLH